MNYYIIFSPIFLNCIASHGKVDMSCVLHLAMLLLFFELINNSACIAMDANKMAMKMFLSFAMNAICSYIH